MFWYKVISNNPSYYFKMYISEITNFLVNCIIMNFHQIFNHGQKKKKKKKIDTPLARLTKGKKYPQITKIRNGSGDFTTNFSENKTKREHYKQLYTNKLNNLDEMD